MLFLVSLIIAAALGLIPAFIAKSKGYSFGLWWFYGWMLFIVAVIHVCVIPDKNVAKKGNALSTYVDNNSKIEKSQFATSQLKEYKHLYDQGIITEDEFNAKKDHLLKLL